MKNILVTGGAGFLGSHLCHALLERGDNVICLDNLSTGSMTNLPEHCDRFQFFLHDICKPFTPVVHIDVIFNLACPASPEQYQKDPVQTTKTCVLGILNLVEMAKNHDSVLVHTSTSEIYGEPDTVPQEETDWGRVNPIGIRSCYDEGKRCAESLLFDFNRQKNIKIKVARLFNTYGPMMAKNDGRVISNFIIQALKGLPLTVYGSGMQTRSFCYVSDTITGLLDFADTDPEVIGPVNIGNPDEVSILGLAKKIIIKTKSTSSVEFRSLPQDDPTRRVPDIQKARMLFDFNPSISLDDGLGKTIAYYRNRI